MSKVLIKWSFDWADEIQVEGYRIYNTEEEWYKVLLDAGKYHEKNPNTELYYGSNEFIMIERFDDMTYTEELISNEEADAIIKHIGSHGGIIDPFTYLSDALDDE